MTNQPTSAGLAETLRGIANEHSIELTDEARMALEKAAELLCSAAAQGAAEGDAPACWIDGGDLEQLAKLGMGGVLGWPDNGNDPRRVPLYTRPAHPQPKGTQLPDPSNPGWCIGCNPDNCEGCGNGLPSQAPAPAPDEADLLDAVEAYMEAQGALDNRELMGPNAPPYEELRRACNRAIEHLDNVISACRTSKSQLKASEGDARDFFERWALHADPDKRTNWQVWSAAWTCAVSWTAMRASQAPAVGERIAGPLDHHPIADIICAWANGFRVEFRYRHHNPGIPEEIYLSDERWHLCGKAYSAWSGINEHRIHADDLAAWEAFKRAAAAHPPVHHTGDDNG